MCLVLYFNIVRTCIILLGCMHVCIYNELFFFPDDFRGKKQTTQYYKVSYSEVTYDLIILRVCC